MKKYANAILITTALSVIGVYAEVDCIALSKSVSQKVYSDKSQVLEIVSKETASAPSCACEIVKAAIKSSKANNKLVGQIVETAISVAPEQRDTIIQCATSAAPDAYLEIRTAAATSRDLGQSSGNPLNVPGINPLSSPLSSFIDGGGAGGTTGGGGGIGGGGLGTLLGGLPAGGLPGGFFGATPGAGGGSPGGNGDLGGGNGNGGGIVNPPFTTRVNPVGFPIPPGPPGPPGPPNPPRP